MSDEDFTPEKQKEYLDKLIMSLMKEGKDINEILAMPYHFVLEILRERNKPKYEKSLIAAFGG
ncbi:hypothetical protein POL88_15510 [Priestia megaterium]|uniref:phage tail assembly chaperone GT n=1 Tax=Priestia megaterium TaxID=1404 RepID=UPI00234F3FC8|nr:hypothetical protein [Priestia megaterium]MDC7770334.1 hypothetical protein [Priestia megaterium]